MRPSAEAFRLERDDAIIALEAGVLAGKNSKALLDGLNIKKLYLMDRWHEHYEHYHVPQIYDYVKGVFKEFSGDDRVCIIGSNSLEFELWPDNYFDYVYLDNDHSYEHVKKEVPFYWEKLKKGGMLCGDNYEQPGVEKAVNEFLEDLPQQTIIRTCEWKKAAGSGIPVLDWWIWK